MIKIICHSKTNNLKKFGYCLAQFLLQYIYVKLDMFPWGLLELFRD